MKRLSIDVEVVKNDEFTVERSGAGVAFQQYSLTGRGVTVAVLDSSVRGHNDLGDPATGKSRVLANVQCPTPRTPAMPAATAAMSRASSPATAGPRPATSTTARSTASRERATWSSMCACWTTRAQAPVSTVIKGIDWAVTNKSAYNIRVLNCRWAMRSARAT